MSSQFPRVTGNTQLLMGWVAGSMAFRAATYRVVEAHPTQGELIIEHERNGNRYRVSFEQISGTEFAEADDASR